MRSIAENRLPISSCLQRRASASSRRLHRFRGRAKRGRRGEGGRDAGGGGAGGRPHDRVPGSAGRRACRSPEAPAWLATLGVTAPAGSSA